MEILNSNVLDVDKKVLEKTNTSKIQTSFDLQALVNNLNEIGDITASDGYVYKKTDLVRTITGLKGSDDKDLQFVTNIYGLRDKVEKLLLKRDLGM